MMDWGVFVLTLILLTIGLVMVFDASVVEAYVTFGYKFHFVTKQAQWMLVGLVGLVVVSRLPLAWIRSMSQYFFIGTMCLLILVLIPGISQRLQGARRWMSIGPFTLQPSELAKLAVVLYFPSWLTQHQRLGPFVAMLGSLAILLMLEPDLGTTIILSAVAVMIYFAAGAEYKTLLALMSGGLLLGGALIISSPYRMNRLQTFLDPTSDPLGTSYHLRQILISLGSGGLTGTGIGQSRQKYQYLPEASTDSIFAVLAEEVGFFGSSIVLGLFGAMIWKMFTTVRSIADPYARLVGVGVTVWIGVQTLLNLAAMVSLVPLTGVPLPFISYGGSSLVTLLLAMGLYLNVSRK